MKDGQQNEHSEYEFTANKITLGYYVTKIF